MLRTPITYVEHIKACKDAFPRNGDTPTASQILTSIRVIVFTKRAAEQCPDFLDGYATDISETSCWREPAENATKHADDAMLKLDTKVHSLEQSVAVIESEVVKISLKLERDVQSETKR